MKLRDTIKIIDSAISAKVPFAPKKAFGYAERYYENDKFYPGIIEGKNITNCFLDDTYDVSWYHRQIIGNADANEENSYGNKNDYVTETNQILLIAYTNRLKINTDLDTLKDIIVSGLPSNLTKAECESLNVRSCEIIYKGHDIDTYKVHKEETNIEKVRAGVQHGLIAIRYDIISTYRRGCTVICECPQ